PNINIFRDPRWGRGQETWGEDPMLTGELGAAFVRGLQGDNPRYLKTAACAKHFAVHSGPEELRHDFDVRPSKKDLRETYLPAFEQLCRQGVEAFMGAYNALYGEPCCGSPFLLDEILRKEWGFKGHVVSDCWAIRDFHTTYKVTGMVEESAALALKSGCDLNCGSTYCDGLDGALLLGLISEAEIDTALRRVIATRFKLGMFDPDDVVPWASLSMDVVNGEPHRRLAKEAAIQSIVLLQNRDGVLPLNESVQNILVVGPLASSVEAMLGNYFGLSGRISTLIEGLALGLHEGLRMDYRKGCLLNQARPNPSDWTFFEAAKSDLVLCCMGLSPDIEGEEGDAIESAHKGDRDRIELPDCQVEFLQQLSARLKEDGSKAKVVVILFGGSAIAIPEVVEFADAIL
ncbi:MAG: glycoside hydrolase family 3 N-terminal domain-containing protein, partial [bacterium]